MESVFVNMPRSNSTEINETGIIIRAIADGIVSNNENSKALLNAFCPSLIFLFIKVRDNSGSNTIPIAIPTTPSGS